MTCQIETTDVFDKWLTRLKDKSPVSRILARIYRFEQGNMGDAKTISPNLFEARLFFGPGYRLYYKLSYCCAVATKAARARTLKKRNRYWRNLEYQNQKIRRQRVP